MLLIIIVACDDWQVETWDKYYLNFDGNIFDKDVLLKINLKVGISCIGIKCF